MSATAYVHVAIASIYAYTLAWDYANIDPARLLVPNAWWSRFVWLTMIDVVIQQVYHVVAAIVAWKKLPRATFDFISTTIVFPVAITVVALFWGLWLANPGLVADPLGRKFLEMNPLYNHAIHTLPLIAMMIDHALWRHARPSKPSALTAILAFSALYISWVVVFNYKFDKWAYPILAQLNLPFRAAFFAGCAAFIIGSYFIADTFNSFLVSPKVNVKQAKASAAVKKALGKSK